MSKMKIGQARCKYCGYKTTTGGIIQHMEGCAKNPKNLKAMSENKNAIWVGDFAGKCIREKVMMNQPDDDDPWYQEKYEAHVASRRSYPYPVSKEQDGKELKEGIDFELKPDFTHCKGHEFNTCLYGKPVNYCDKDCYITFEAIPIEPDDWPIQCSLDEQQCREECEYKNKKNREGCPFASRLPYKKEFEEYFKKYYPHLIEPETPLQQKDELIGRIIAAQIGQPEQVDIIQKHMDEYFKRFPSYKSKFNDLEWYHIFLDFLDKIPPPLQPVKDEGAIELMSKSIRCLALELPESVWKDVAANWQAVLNQLSSPPEPAREALERLYPFCHEDGMKGESDWEKAWLNAEAVLSSTLPEPSSKEQEGYWKKRCEAVEGVIDQVFNRVSMAEAHAVGKSYHEWQELKNKNL